MRVHTITCHNMHAVRSFVVGVQRVVGHPLGLFLGVGRIRLIVFAKGHQPIVPGRHLV